VSVQDLANAIVSGITAGGEQFLEGTLAAVLPVIWLAILGLHLGRPYILNMIDRFTLRLGADLLWLVYVALRDLLIISGVIMSFMFFFPDVVLADQLPLTGGLAACALFGVLLVKLIGDPDHNLRDFQLTTGLLGLGAIFYFVPYVLGVQSNAVATGTFATISNFLVTKSNPNWAVGMGYVSVALLAIMGAVAAGYTLITGGRADAEETSVANP
jgi:prepilin signal peptidase PulO-like enzyme (type II secretory pathway)